MIKNLPMVIDKGVNVEAKRHPFEKVPIFSYGLAGKNLIDTVDSTRITFYPGTDAIILVNNVPIPREDWETFYPIPGDQIKVLAVPTGRGRGKDVLRVVLTMAVIALSWGAGSFIGAGYLTAQPLGSLLSSAAFVQYGTMAFSAAYMYGGMMLVNAICPPPKPERDNSIASESSHSFGLEAAKNTANLWQPVPLLLGRHKIFPPYGAQPYTEIVGNDQYLRLLFCLGYGPIHIEDPKIGDTDINSFNVVEGDNQEVRVNYAYYSEFNPETDNFKWFTNDIDEEALSVLLEHSTGPHIITTGVDADALSLDLSALNGLVHVHDDGSKTGIAVELEIKYRKVGDSSWSIGNATQDIPEADVLLKRPGLSISSLYTPDITTAIGYSYTRIGINKTSGEIVTTVSSRVYTSFGHRSAAAARKSCPNLPEWVAPICGVSLASTDTAITAANITDLRDGQLQAGSPSDFLAKPTDPPSWFVHIDAGSLTYKRTMGGKETSAIRSTFYIALPSKGQYEVSVARISEDTNNDRILDKITWTALRTIRNVKPVQKAGLSFFEMRIKASDNLNGVISNFNCVATSLFKSWNATAKEWTTEPVPTNNPADLFRAIFQGPFNKKAITDSRLNLEEIQEWHEYCKDNGFTFNMYLDGRKSVHDTANLIAAAGRASMTHKDGQISIIIDKERSTVAQIFTPDNSRDFSATKKFINLPHAFRVTFPNQNKDWLTDERIVYDDGYTKANASIFEELQLPGITHSSLAWKHGRYHLAQLRLRPETYSITTDVENLRCTRGDLVRVNHDITKWGLGSGRIKALKTSGSDTTGVILSDFVTFDEGKTHVLRVRLADGSIQVHEVTDYSGVQEDPTSSMLSHNGLGSFSAVQCVDNSLSTVGFNTNTSEAGAYLLITSDVPKAYGSFYLYLQSAGYNGVFNVEFSDNGTDWYIAYSNFSPSAEGWNLCRWSEKGSHKYWRLYLTNTPGVGPNIIELQTFLASNVTDLNFTTPVLTSTGPQVGDLCTFGVVNEDSVECLVKSIKPGQDLSAMLELVDYSPAIYNSDTGTIPEFNTHITSPLGTYVPIIKSVQSDANILLRQPDGSLASRMLVTFEYVSNRDLHKIQHIEGQYRVNGGAFWRTLPLIPDNATEVSITDIEDGETYDLRFRYVYNDNRQGQWSKIVTHTVIGKSGPPSNATFDHINTVFGKTAIKFVINAIPDPDLDFYEIRTDTNFGSNINLVTRTRSLVVNYSPVAAGRTYYIKARDTSKQYSANADSISDSYTGIEITIDETIVTTAGDFIMRWSIDSNTRIDRQTLQVYSDSSYLNLIRTVNNVAENQYRYTFEMNKSDDAVIPRRQRYFKLTVYDTLGQSAVKYFDVEKPQPSSVTISSITPVLNGLEIEWYSNSDAISYVVACDTENPPVKYYHNIKNTILTILDLNSEVDYYIRVYAMDAFGSGSIGATHSARPKSLSLKDYALDVPMTKGIVWSTNSRVEWTEGVLTYGSNEYTIETGNTTDTYIWWDKNTPTTFQHSNDKPTLDTNKWMMAIYDSENDEVFVAQSGKIIHGGLIQAGTILAEHIGAGEITADRLNIGNWQSAVDTHVKMLLHFDGSLNATSGLEPINDGATLRPDGYFGGGVGVDEATVNLIATQGSAAQDWTAWRHWRTVASAYWTNQEIVLDPDYGFVWAGIGTSVESYLYHYDVYTLLQGQTLTFSIYLKADEEITLSRLRFYTRREGGSSDYVNHDPVSITLTPKWQRFTWTTTVPADATGIGVNLYFGALEGKKLYAAYPQLEEKTFATSFVNGSRAAGSLTYEHLCTPKGSVHFKIQLLQPIQEIGTRMFFEMDNADRSNLIAIRLSQGGNLNWFVRDGVIDVALCRTDISSTGLNWVPGEWHTVQATWDFDTGKWQLILDGVMCEETQAATYSQEMVNLNIGCNINNMFHCNAIIDEFRVDDIVRTHDELNAWRESNAPFSDPNAFINKSGTVEITHKGIRVTGSSGVIESGSKSVAFEDVAGWADAADTTLINGGVIKTGTIYLNRLIGTSGTLTISSSGKIIVQTSEGLEVTQGGDIILKGSDTDPGSLIFATAGGSGRVEMGLDAAGSNLYMNPITDGVGDLYIGSAEVLPPWRSGGSHRRHNHVYMYALSGAQLVSYYNGSHLAGVSAYSNSSQASVTMQAGSSLLGGFIRILDTSHPQISLRGFIQDGIHNIARINAGVYTGTGQATTQTIRYTDLDGLQAFTPKFIFIMYPDAYVHSSLAYQIIWMYPWNNISYWNGRMYTDFITNVTATSFKIGSFGNISGRVYTVVIMG